MLTWKMFVTIMSMVSLTLQMDPLDAGSSSSSSQLWVKDPESGSYYPSSLNRSNPFNPGLDAHICFAILRLYCRTQNDEVTSDDCAKQGILFYRIKESNPLKRRRQNSISWIDDFFQNFSLNSGEIDFPAEFCRKQKAPPNITKDISFREIASFAIHYKAPTCVEELKDYNAEIETPLYQTEYFMEIAKNISRDKIVYFALCQRATLGLPKNSFETKYLEHISEHVSSRNQNNEVTSDDCAKQGIFYYSIKERNQSLRDVRDPMSWLDDFFDYFPLDIRMFDLPKEFCSKQKVPLNIAKDVSLREIAGGPLHYKSSTSITSSSINDLQDYIVSTCIDDLKYYIEHLRSLDDDLPQDEDNAKYLSCASIAWFALQSKVTLRLHKESFETKYLEYISENVSSTDSEHNPYNYCRRRFRKNATHIFVSNFLTNYLEL